MSDLETEYYQAKEEWKRRAEAAEAEAIRYRDLLAKVEGDEVWMLRAKDAEAKLAEAERRTVEAVVLVINAFAGAIPEMVQEMGIPSGRDAELAIAGAESALETLADRLSHSDVFEKGAIE